MNDSILARLEKRESQILAPYGCRSSNSQGRERYEPADEFQTAYMVDRSRILNCKAFRRLKDKTQVFVAPEEDHLRTRLTHTLEVTQAARTVGRALALNEDLIEAIALGHDLGHPPFGHAGESALDEAVRNSKAPGDPIRFDHAEQSLRVVDVLEDLNLTFETRMGILTHRKQGKDISNEVLSEAATLEASVVRLCDRIAYMNHDLDDAIRMGILKSIPNQFKVFGENHHKRVEAMLKDVIECSYQKPTIAVSQTMLEFMNSLKQFLFANVYHAYPRLYRDIVIGQNKVRQLFEYFEKGNGLPEGFTGKQGAVDYIAGMTDRFALNFNLDLV